MNLVESIDPMYIDIASAIVKEFETTLHTKINDMMVVSLSDHISNAIRKKKTDSKSVWIFLVKPKTFIPLPLVLP